MRLRRGRNGTARDCRVNLSRDLQIIEASLAQRSRRRIRRSAGELFPLAEVVASFSPPPFFLSSSSRVIRATQSDLFQGRCKPARNALSVVVSLIGDLAGAADLIGPRLIRIHGVSKVAYSGRALFERNISTSGVSNGGIRQNTERSLRKLIRRGVNRGK